MAWFKVGRLVMLRPLMVGIVVCMSWPSFATSLGGGNADARQQLRTAILDRELYLRNFDAARSVSWTWNGSALIPDSPATVKSISALRIEHISIAHDVVTLDGTRRSLLRDGRELILATQVVPVQLMIAIPHQQQAAVLPQLAGLLFFPTRAEALAALPPVYSGLLPTSTERIAALRPERCDCADLGQPSCEGKSAVIGLRRPRLLSQVDPDFSEEARHKKFSGDVRVVFTVGDSGHPVDFWIAHGVGLGLDEKSVAATRQYTFEPGTCHGQPAPVPLAVDVNFQIF